MANTEYSVKFCEEEKGILYKLVDTEEEFELATEFYFEYYLKGL